MLETYSNATITYCCFNKNQASDDGGAVYCRRRSQLIIRDSYLQANNAWNNGGAILVQHSLAIISFSILKMTSLLWDIEVQLQQNMLVM